MQLTVVCVQNGKQAEKEMELLNLGPSDEKQIKKLTYSKKPKAKKTNTLKTLITSGKRNAPAFSFGGDLVGEENGGALH